MVIPKFIKTWDFLFFILLIGISFLYSYNIILWMRPYSIHQWRQCDCLSITLNYYKEGMHFFSPSVHMIGPSGNGMASTSECPLIYYTVACLWKIFGYHEFIYRLFVLTIAFTGLYALFCLTKELTGDGAWALMVALFLFSSPIFAVYANNFLTEVPSLSVALIAWYFFVRYYKTKLINYYDISILLFLLAGLFKISALLSFLPLIFIFIGELFQRKNMSENQIFIKPLRQVVPIFLLITVMISWTSYSMYYNNLHNYDLFSTRIFPFWKYDKDTLRDVTEHFYHWVIPAFYYPGTTIFIFGLFIYLLFNFRKLSRFYFWLILSVFCGCIIYLVLWYRVMDVHDYYLINLLIFIPLVLIAILVFLKDRFHAIFISPLVKIIFAIILAWNIYYCAVQINLRYPTNTLPVKKSFVVNKDTKNFWDWFYWNYDSYYKAYETITPYLRQIGISREYKVISLPDNSINITLYLMDQKGFSGYEIEQGYGFGWDKNQIMKSILALKPKYLFICNDTYLAYDWLKPLLKTKIGTYQNVNIYDLRYLN
jgi:hypothetical protein